MTREAKHRCVLLLILLLCLSTRLSSQNDEEWNWINEHFGPALSELMPIQQSSGFYVAYRSHRDYQTSILEYSFVIGYDPNENGPGLQEYLSAHVRIADSLSIHDQMMKMHSSNPQEDAANIQKQVKLKTWDFTQKTCPAIQRQFDKFQVLRFGTPVFDQIVFHPLVHTFHIQAGMGNMDLVLTDEGHPLVKWALETRHALEACTASSKSTKQN